MAKPRPRHTPIPKANRLWIARKRAGYPLKWVCSLLGKRSVSIVSDYERGQKLPSLTTALKLEMVYQKPLSELFPGLHAQLIGELAAVRRSHPQLLARDREMRAQLAAETEAPAQLSFQL